ncbi:ATP-dependent DNA helicase [Pseudomonas sp. HR96]|uniref:ATP-dependent DNA helicase n=1 Tax=Pseudomonas sp. HR96 TaxID=1027966 RepID=UPI002A7490BB|nr:ATP-dependent DNA helicase [Pseudomonas sp. HR96]WPP02218.1 ATP-dependent DNA helicase [Pseudomonas sp. HR96]
MIYQIAVRALCEFTAKVGDLDLRFTPSPTAQEGMAGHRRVAAGRGGDYQSEVSLSGGYGPLQVRGRADGYDPRLNRVEEIKTHRGDLARQPANHRQLHWAQARVYAWLLCDQLQRSEMRVALVYLDVDSDRQTLFEETWSAADLRTWFEQQCEIFLAFARHELERLAERDQGLRELRFPYADFRAGQRDLAETVYKAVSTGRCLLAQATTGIGKTLATLFPLLKAVVPQQLDKILFLTAKTPGRQLALDALQQLQRSQPGLALRSLELVARDKACEYPDRACHGDACPLAKGFYDRLPAARTAALARPMLDRQSLREVALAHQVCPYYLSQELARWVDVVVGDYNYYFDLTALLHGLALANQWNLALLVDEAHNLVDRARMMYSATLEQWRLKALRKAPPARLKSALQRLDREWNALYREQGAPYQAYPRLPDKFLLALLRCVSLIGEEMNEQPLTLDRPLLDFYFEALQFTRVAELFDENYVFDISLRETPGRKPLASLCVRNVVPASLLAPRLKAPRSSVLFSATLNPQRYYRDLLGMPADCAWLDVQSPFHSAQLQVRIADHISTRYAHRQASLAPIVELMAQQYAQAPGNYLAFFSSFDYLQQVATLMAREHPQITLWQQQRQMDEAARRGFLEQFAEHSQGIGFAVLGGAFGEGIDLPGRRLIGAFVATLGLPQLNPVNEQIKQRMAALFAAGYDYAYLYPGLQKVIQAAGRVIRGVEDQGVVVLIDDRFAEAKVQRLFPAWWALQPPP